MDATVLKLLLAQLATELDAPQGPGSGLIALDIVTGDQCIEHTIPPAEPSSS